ncbi:MAG: DUF433 domain-containing protein [Chloroflexi bacterium]|nr:DUF433 domain-containing protein [Chloroflexota bacterium]
MEVRHYKLKKITLDPEKCFGKPCMRGRGMLVASILGYLSSGAAIEDILKERTELGREDILEALGIGSHFA